MLTKKNELFAKQYILTHNATESAKRVGYSQRTAYSIGQRLLKKIEVREVLGRLERENEERYKITQDSLVRETVNLQQTSNDDKLIRDCIRLKAEITGNIKGNRQETTILIDAREKAILTRYGLGENKMESGGS